MKLQMKNSKILKDVFAGVSEIIDEVLIECDGEGLTLKSLSRDHTTFVELVLKSSLFDDYECPLPESFGIDTVTLDSILKRCKNNEALELELGTVLIVRINGTRNKKFEIGLIDLEEYEVPNPSQPKFPLEITVPTNVLNDSIRDIDSILKDDTLPCKIVLFSIENNHLILKGNDRFVDITDEIIHNVDVDDEIESLFTLGHVKNILISSRLAKECILRLGNHMPLEVIFNIGEGSFVKYLLAPRLEVD